MVKIYRKNSGVIAKGDTLKEACLNWNNKRFSEDDLYEEFKKSKFFTQDFDFENDDSAYFDFIDSLSGEEMFDIMRDGKYNYYEEY